MTRTLLALAAATALLMGTSAGTMAQTRTPPGQQMQENGPAPGSPGASGYSPGHEMQQNGSAPGSNGASGYAPGNSTTGAATDNDRMKGSHDKSDMNDKSPSR